MKKWLLEFIAFLLLGVGISFLPSLFGKAYILAFHFLSSCFLSGGFLIAMATRFRVPWSVALKDLAPSWKRLSWRWPLLFIPLLFITKGLYPWEDFSGHKGLFFTWPFVLIRNLLYIGLSILAAHQMQRRAPLSLVLFFFVGTFVSFDWGMSLEGAWASNIYGLLWLANGAMIASALSFFPNFQAFGKKDRKDVIALMFTMSALSVYLHYSQFIIMWMANRPSEVIWYLNRYPLFAVIILVVKLLPVTLAALYGGGRLPVNAFTAVAASFVIGPLLEIIWIISPAMKLSVLHSLWVCALLLILTPPILHWSRRRA